MLLQGYHDQVAPIQKVEVIEGLVTGHTFNKEMMVPLVLDYGVWSEQAASVALAITHSTKGQQAKKIQLYVTGRVSPRAVEELEGRGWEVHPDAWGKLYPGATDVEEAEQQEEAA